MGLITVPRHLIENQKGKEISKLAKRGVKKNTAVVFSSQRNQMLYINHNPKTRLDTIFTEITWNRIFEIGSKGKTYSYIDVRVCVGKGLGGVWDGFVFGVYLSKNRQR